MEMDFQQIYVIRVLTKQIRPIGLDCYVNNQTISSGKIKIYKKILQVLNQRGMTILLYC